MEILNYIQHSSSKYPNKHAILHKDEAITYMELMNQIEVSGERIEEWLGAFDYPIGLYIPNHPDFIIGYYSLVRAQKVVHLVDDKWTESELLNLVRHAHLGGFLIRTELKANFPLLELVQEEWTVGSLTLVKLLDSVLSSEFDKMRLEGIISCRYSSGTTGIAKCMMYESKNVIAAAYNWAQTIELSDSDRVYCAASLSHGLAFNTSILAPLRAGATIILHDDIHPREVRQVIYQYQPTIFVAFPILYDLMSRGEAKYEYPHLRICVSSGTILHQTIKQRFRTKYSIGIADLYGVAETGLSVLNREDDKDSVGYPVKNVLMKIMNNHAEEMNVGETGEVAICTESRARAYYNFPGQLEAKLSNNFYLTGDIGYISEEGKLFIVGRKSDVVDISGKKVDPREVEEVLLELAGIEDVAVYGKKLADSLLEVLAVAIVADGTVTREKVVLFCAERLVSYKIPQIVKFMNILPRNTYGKVLRAELQKMD